MNERKMIYLDDAIAALERDILDQPVLHDAIATIRELPSAQPERKKGKWEWNNSDELYYSCSCCGHKAYGNTLEIIDGTYHYCPNCGADMKGESNDETH